MTAEISILNKSAVALATDSAVTISYGTEAQKIYESADKLFEASTSQPIGIMIYNGMSFMEMPIPTIVKDFRRLGRTFDTIQAAGQAFLEYLNDEAQDSPNEVVRRSNEAAVRDLVHGIFDDISRPEVTMQILDSLGAEGRDEFVSAYNDLLRVQLKTQLAHYDEVNPANFVGGGVPQFTKTLKETYLSLISDRFQSIELEEATIELFVTLCGLVMKGERLSSGYTGIVVAGFGKSEKFPTLVSYQIDGIVGGRLKYIETHNIDIDRIGHVAKVIPFAQKEMVDRFVYGIDESVTSGIIDTCRKGMEEFCSNLASSVNINDTEQSILAAAGAAGKQAFLSKLKNDAIQSIRERSQKEIEDMVSFMPKPEMANMAEALVGLTSIKRRVSRGMETVGGPIDVAIISREDGFVWVRRKHYFSAEQNIRYGLRKSKTIQNQGGNNDAQ